MSCALNLTSWKPPFGNQYSIRWDNQDNFQDLYDKGVQTQKYRTVFKHRTIQAQNYVVLAIFSIGGCFFFLLKTVFTWILLSMVLGHLAKVLHEHRSYQITLFFWNCSVAWTAQDEGQEVKKEGKGKFNWAKWQTWRLAN